MAVTVVPKRLAIADSVSPGCTIYVLPPGGGGGGGGGPGGAATGRLIICPTKILFGSVMRGLAARIAETVVPKRLAMDDSVSPGCTTYVLPPGGGGGGGGGVGPGAPVGTVMICPTKIRFGSVTWGLAARMAETVVPKRRAIDDKVSPG